MGPSIKEDIMYAHACNDTDYHSDVLVVSFSKTKTRDAMEFLSTLILSSLKP